MKQKKVFNISTKKNGPLPLKEGCSYCLHITDHTPMQLEQYYTCCIARRRHNTLQTPFCKAGSVLLVFNYNIDDGSGGSDVGM